MRVVEQLRMAIVSTKKKKCTIQYTIILLIFIVLLIQYFKIAYDVTMTSKCLIKPTTTNYQSEMDNNRYMHVDVSTYDSQLVKQNMTYARASDRLVSRGAGLDKQARKTMNGKNNSIQLYRFRNHHVDIEEEMMFEEHMRHVQLRDKTRVRNDTCESCFNYTFKYIITGDKICGRQPYLDLIFLITTAHTHFRRREILRNTWLSQSRYSTGVRYVFLMGNTHNVKLRERLQAENEIYKDIVMGDFNDTYLNLTYKTVMGLRWVTEMCAKSRYVMKTDDDIFVNVPELVNMLRSRFLQEKLNKSIMGSCVNISKPNRDENSKYFASLTSYPHFYYPPFCSGTGYVMSMQTAQEVYKVTRNVPFFHLEDVYIGLCLKQLGFEIFNYFGFSLNMRKARRICRFKNKKIVSVHALNQSKIIEKLWNSTFCNHVGF